MRDERRAAFAFFGGAAGLLRWLGAMAFLILLLAEPAPVLRDVREALALWANAVAPSLFPFLAVLPLLTSPEAQAIYARLLGGPVRMLFRLPAAAAAPLAVGLLAGSPTGALACARSRGLNADERKRLALIACGTGPVYLISGVGVGLFGSRALGLRLAGAQLLAQLTTGFLLRPLSREGRPCPPAAAATPEQPPMRLAVLNVLQVAGYMALFAALSGMVNRVFGARIGTAARLALDLPTGMGFLAELSLEVERRLPLAAMLAGFGGLCIGAQNMAVLKPLGVRWRAYLGVKAAQGLLCAAYCRIGMAAGKRAGMDLTVAGLLPLNLAALAAAGLAVVGAIGFAALSVRRRKADLRG